MGTTFQSCACLAALSLSCNALLPNRPIIYNFFKQRSGNTIHSMNTMHQFIKSISWAVFSFFTAVPDHGLLGRTLSTWLNDEKVEKSRCIWQYEKCCWSNMLWIFFLWKKHLWLFGKKHKQKLRKWKEKDLWKRKDYYNYVKQRVKGKPIMEVKMVVEFQNGTK